MSAKPGSGANQSRAVFALFDKDSPCGVKPRSIEYGIFQISIACPSLQDTDGILGLSVLLTFMADF